MGCCSPEYRKIVNEKEEEINKTKSRTLFAKDAALSFCLVHL